MNEKYLKWLTIWLWILVLSPFWFIGFIWSEISDAISDGKDTAKHFDRKYDRWLNGNS
jgi:hypothetical protein